MQALANLFRKLPWTALLVGYLVLQAYGLFEFFTNDTESPYLQKVRAVEAEKGRVSELERKRREAEEFLKSLDVKRAELRTAAQELSQMKATLAEDLDIAAFIKTLVTEAKRVNIRVQAIEPGGEDRKDFYVSQVFKFRFKGVFAQVVVFLERLLQSTRIVSVDGYEFSPTQASAGRYAELEGTLSIRTYRYNRSKADEVAAQQGGTP